MARLILFLHVLTAQLVPLDTFQANVIDDLSEHFKSGNSKEISRYFANSVELIISDAEDVYSKAQAEQILRDFFSKNDPVKSTVVHHINTNPNFRFGILSLTTRSGKFRVSITLKKAGSSFQINELRIEADK